MSKYKEGDRVVLEMVIDDVDETSNDFWVGLKRDEETSGMWLKEEQIDKYAYKGASKTYEDGLDDAWELAGKIMLSKAEGGYTTSEINRFFNTLNEFDVLRNFTYQQALAKIEAYEKSQQIQVGDVVYADDEPDSFGVVTWVNEGMIYVMWDDGSSGMESDISDYHKTGRHIDIQHILEQIRGNE